MFDRNMSDKSLIREIVLQIEDAIQRVQRRFSRIESSDDFLRDEQGRDMLDSIGMMLLTIGENIKKIDCKTSGELLKKYPSVDWKGLKGMRDILAHRYYDLDAAEVFEICEKDIPKLSEATSRMLKDLLLDN